MAVFVYKSTDVGAPVLNGAIGSFIALLDACLVTGYGTGLDTKSPAGWTKPFSSTNLATYRPAAGNRFYLGVNDTTTLTARVRGFEVATAAGTSIDYGTGPFPTDVQFDQGLYFHKSTSTLAAQPWTVVADGSRVWIHNNVYGDYSLFFFGGFVSYRPIDNYNTAIIGATYSSDAPTPTQTVTTYGATTLGHFLARKYDQTGESVLFGVAANATRGGSTRFGTGSLPYPSPMENSLVLDRCTVQEATVGARGHIPGMWNPMHTVPIVNGSTFTGNGALAGRTFLAKNLLEYSGQVMFETSNTWES